MTTAIPPDPFAHPASALALEVFRLNGALIALGDALVAPLGLTSARWQVLGAVAAAPDGLPTADIARNMGLARQSVQRVVDDLAAAGFLAFAPNPRHKRAKLVRLTGAGAAAFETASALWAPIADAVADRAGSAGITATTALLRQIREILNDVHPARRRAGEIPKDLPNDEPNDLPNDLPRDPP